LEFEGFEFLDIQIRINTMNTKKGMMNIGDEIFLGSASMIS
jgi:hypothetical protein